MKKTGIILLIVLLIFIIMGLVNVLVASTRTGGKWFMKYGKLEKTKENIVKEQTIDLKDIKNFSVNFTSSDVDVIVSEDKELKVVQYAREMIAEERQFKMEKYGTSIEVSEPSLKTIFPFNILNLNQIAYEIYLPREYSENLKIGTVSGDINIQSSLKLEKAEFTSTSGEITGTSKIIADTIQTKTVSGEIEFYQLEANQLEAKSTSGNIQVENIMAKEGKQEGIEVIAKTVSGEITLQQLEGKIEATSTSGNVRIGNFKVLGDSILKSTSGNIYASIDKSSNASLSGKTTSGRIKYTDDKKHIGTEPYHTVEAKTTSGNINF